MEIRERVVVSRPPAEVWRFLADVPAVVACLPGAELGERRDDGTYAGALRVKVGPISARLEGEGRIMRDEAAMSGRIDGKGVDRRGGSRATATLHYAVLAAEGGRAAIEVSADVVLSGPLAQIGRSGLVEDVARSMTETFAENLERRLSEVPGAAEPSRETAAFDAGRAVSRGLWARLLAWLKRLFGRA